jgi:hypothetical protein
VRRALRRLGEDHLGPEAGEDHPGQLAAVVGGVDHPVRGQHRWQPPLAAGTPSDVAPVEH